MGWRKVLRTISAGVPGAGGARSSGTSVGSSRFPVIQRIQFKYYVSISNQGRMEAKIKGEGGRITFVLIPKMVNFSTIQTFLFLPYDILTLLSIRHFFSFLRKNISNS